MSARRGTTKRCSTHMSATRPAAARIPAHRGTGSGALVVPWAAVFWASVAGVVPSDSGVTSPVAGSAPMPSAAASPGAVPSAPAADGR